MEEEKKWYQVTFYARMSPDDVKAMSKYFFDTMSESMLIAECAGLNIEEDITNE